MATHSTGQEEIGAVPTRDGAVTWNEATRYPAHSAGVMQPPGGAVSDQASKTLPWVPSSSPKTWQALDFLSIGDAMIFDRIWFTPEEIDAEFITEDTEHEIRIWNAFLSTDKILTNIASSSPTGTDLDSPSTPYTIPAGVELSMTLT